MPRPTFCGLVAAAALALSCLGLAASDAAAQQAPAVSAINGKIEFDAGALVVPAPAFLSRAAGALTLPLGQAFGVQADIAAAATPGFSVGGALHLFARDPASYLIGGTLGVVRTPGATVLAAGPEAELYFDRWTLEAWAGLSYAHPATSPARLAPFVMADIATYPTDNLRLSLGLSALDGYGALHAGAEYLLDGLALPLTLSAEARLGQDGALLATLGLKALLGGTPKTLIRHHREDDPVNRGTALYKAVGGATIHAAGPDRSREPASLGDEHKDGTEGDGGATDTSEDDSGTADICGGAGFRLDPFTFECVPI